MNGLHVAIIMDGNGRWARTRGRPRWRGHVAGVDSVREVVRAAPALGIRYLTLYAFSADNWKRPWGEVGRLFWLLREYCARERDELLANGVRLTAVGRRDRIPRRAREAVEDLERQTAHGQTLDLRLAIDYSGRGAIADAARHLSHQVQRGELTPDEITDDMMDRAVSGGFPPPDLLIRTAGERRLSDFLLWDAAYAELFYCETLWPDFRRPDLARALEDFRSRDRRFGAVPETAPIVATPVESIAV